MVSPAYLPHPHKCTCTGYHFYLPFFLLGIVESIVEDINILRLNTFLQYICLKYSIKNKVVKQKYCYKTVLVGVVVMEGV